MNETRRIDLKVPTGWNQCSAAQLETVAGIILRRTMMQDRYHPFDMEEVKTEAFLALAGLTVVDVMSSAVETSQEISPQGRNDKGDDTFIVRQGKGEPFEIATWQVHSFVKKHMTWLDDFTGLQLFPYHDLGHYWTLDRHWPFAHRHRLGFDGELLDGMTWQAYRWANEWLSYYTDVNNQPAQSGQSGGELLRARTEFLRAVYRLPDGHSPRALRRMSAARFQVILIWWQSMMAEMQKKYRRCFKTEQTRGRQSRKVQLPIDLYTRSIATLQDKYKLTEDEINRQPCRVILQHLDDMAHEAEEMEKINKRMKHR